MATKYTIYIGRFKVSQFEAEDIRTATQRFDEIAKELTETGTCTLYEGKRAMENMCTQLEISDRRLRAKGGKSRWAGMTKEQRSAEMKRVRAAGKQNDKFSREAERNQP